MKKSKGFTLVELIIALVIILIIIVLFYSAISNKKCEEICKYEDYYYMDVPWGEDNPLGYDFYKAVKMANGNPIYKIKSYHCECKN